ncbi:hypothetical protein RIF29_30128 [Crotalaria pallida]|uniref:Uncharacterized protein n=1 Tax=Crotalaria pallida TaxID=3830 RepID=A0AAN9HUH4_CROPI
MTGGHGCISEEGEAELEAKSIVVYAVDGVDSPQDRLEPWARGTASKTEGDVAAVDIVGGVVLSHFSKSEVSILSHFRPSGWVLEALHVDTASGVSIDKDTDKSTKVWKSSLRFSPSSRKHAIKEIKVVAYKYGNVVHFGEHDCNIQGYVVPVVCD